MNLLSTLKENDQDFEWYPTTNAILNYLFTDLYDLYLHNYKYRKGMSFLDIGAGNGKVLDRAQEWSEQKRVDIQTFAIEKSSILIKELAAKNHMIVGTDFHEQSLLHLQAEVCFCNPPYKEYESWTARILRCVPADCLYLVIPTRWENSKLIQDALEYRGGNVNVLGEFSFISSEDRTARATVNLIRIERKHETCSLFEKFFLEEFGSPSAEKSTDDKEEKETIKADLISRKGLVQALVHLYEQEMMTINDNYKKIVSLDAAMLKEVGIDTASMITILDGKIKAVRTKYWKEIFDNLNSITNRLTSKNRRNILERINKACHVDFTESNIYSIICWLIAHSEKYVDQQILEVFDDMLNASSVKKYASNKRVFDSDTWRYNQDRPTHVYLDYRIVRNCGGLIKDYSWIRMTDNGQRFLSDVLCVANILGFSCDASDPRVTETYGQTKYWERGKPQEFRDSKGRVIVEVKAFLNGNSHLRLGQEFALALNVAVGKLRGWIHCKNEAAKEMKNKAAAAAFDFNHRTIQLPKMLSGASHAIN